MSELSVVSLPKLYFYQRDDSEKVSLRVLIIPLVKSLHQ